ncbi:voltage-gated potassium channel [Aureococcus anophagefferens]|nr:voltage-gated potassium channel [Aureococcus anophagefferens]
MPASVRCSRLSSTSSVWFVSKRHRMSTDPSVSTKFSRAKPSVDELWEFKLSSVSTYKFTYKDFVKEDDIKAYLEMIGVDTDDSEEKFDYVPREVTIEYDSKKVEGSLGSDAAGGYLLTGLTFTASSGFTSSYVLAVAEDKVFYISSRQTDAIVKMDVEGKVEWTLGGEYGDYEIEDSDGTVYKAGKTVWSGQHNAEFFGEDEFCMFDNQEKPDNHYSHSRLLCVKLEKDGSTRRGVVTFSYSMGAYTPHFGDADRLPTGNMLGVHWPDELTDATDYDVGRSRSSRRRRPRLGDEDAVVTFDVVNNFKQMNVYDGTYMIKTISKDDTVDKTDGTLSFLAHWRTTPVSVDVPSAAAKATVIVTNQWGDDVSTEVDCTKSP